MIENQQKALDYINSLNKTRKEQYIKILNGPIEDMGLNHIKLKCNLLGIDITDPIDLNNLEEIKQLAPVEVKDKYKIDKKNTVLQNLHYFLIHLGIDNISSKSICIEENPHIPESFKKFFKQNPDMTPLFFSEPELYSYYKHKILEVYDRTSVGCLSQKAFMIELTSRANINLYNCCKANRLGFEVKISSSTSRWFPTYMFLDKNFTNLRKLYE